MAFLISALDGCSMLICNSASAGAMSGGMSGGGRLSTVVKCSVHLLSCSSVDERVLPSLSFIGLFVCWNLPASFLVVVYNSLRFPQPAASSA
ncbi:hypothetical protein ElyMa_006313300, partial [Elysia marginata]